MDAENSGLNGHGSEVPGPAVGYRPYEPPYPRSPAAGDADSAITRVDLPAFSGAGEWATRLETASSIASLLDQAAQSLTAVSEEFPQAATRSRGLGRWLRVLTGVDERLLDRIWEERARYTGLGAIVLGTAIMAMLSMLDALDQVFGPIWPVMVLVALFWGAFVCGLDRWLISSTHGMRSSRWRIFLPRIGLALLFGVIIATPLVLTVFGSEIVSQAAADQNNAVTDYESRWTACNPLPDAAGQPVAPPAGCAHYRLNVTDPAIGTDAAITQEKAQRSQLSQTVASDQKMIAAGNLTAREECNGVHGQGLSGIVGAGPNCGRDRKQADALVTQSHVSQLEDQLTTLSEKIAQQTSTAGTQTQGYATAITTGIAKLVATKRADEGRIGLLNRIDALGELAAKHAVIAGATVLLGLFIIMVDCLPVLSKMMSGTTRYDKLVDERLRTAEAIAAARMKLGERQATGRDEIALDAIEREIRNRLDKLEDASQLDRAKRDAQLDRQIAELATEFRNEFRAT